MLPTCQHLVQGRSSPTKGGRATAVAILAAKGCTCVRATIEICFHHPCNFMMSVIFRQADLPASSPDSSTYVYPEVVRTNIAPKLRMASLLGVRNQTTRLYCEVRRLSYTGICKR